MMENCGSIPAAYRTLRRLMNGKAPDALVIGIPRSLGYFIYPKLWETFFQELGMKVLVSGATTRKTIERAGLISEAEHCLPVKLFDAHVAEIAGKVDRVFVPRILSSLAGHMACPKLGALPDVAQVQFGEQTEILTIDIDENKVPLEDALLGLGRKLKVADGTIRTAIRSALEALRAGRRTPPARGGNGSKKFLILGHPYNLHDEYLSGPIFSKLEALNAGIEWVSYDVRVVPAGPIRWDTCSIMHAAIQRLDPKTCAGVIQLSSFNCGCDSIVGELFKGILRKKGIPCMTLVLDEHSGQAGVDTRLEAFVDSIGW